MVSQCIVGLNVYDATVPRGTSVFAPAPAFSLCLIPLLGVSRETNEEHSYPLNLYPSPFTLNKNLKIGLKEAGHSMFHMEHLPYPQCLIALPLPNVSKL